MHNQIRACLLDKIRDINYGGWGEDHTAAQVWFKVVVQVHKHIGFRSIVSNNVVRHLKGFR